MTNRSSTMVDDDTYVIHGPRPEKPLPSVSLGSLIYNSLLVNGSKPALVDAVTGKYVSYNTLLQKTCSLAESLRRSGYGKDTVVSISSENNLQFFIPLIACLYNGAIVAPINHVYTEAETVHSLNICKPKIIFCSKEVSRKFLLLKNTKLFYIEKIIIIDSDDDIYGTEKLDDFIERGLKGNPFLYRIELEDFDPRTQIALIMCSSGTTGLPKGVMQTHTNLVVRYMHTLDPRYVSISSTVLGILPFFHGYGLTTTFIALTIGQTVVVMKRFQEEIFLKSIETYKISSLWLAPPLVVFLAKSPLVDKYDLSSVKEITSGAAPLSKDTEEMVKKRLNIPTIRQGYGLTEATLAVLMMEIGDIKHGSSGKVVTYMSCKVRDPETGKSLGPGQVGELCFKGPMVTPGYYNNKQATKESFTSDGWLLTGDLGYYSEDGYFYIVDRLKELIKYKGFQVAPAELEAILLSHPKIQDVGVVGLTVADESIGEVPIAFVVKKDKTLCEKEVIQFVEGKVSSQKRLRGGVIFVSTIPKNPSGKILRRELRKMAKTYKSKL